MTTEPKDLKHPYQIDRSVNRDQAEPDVELESAPENDSVAMPPRAIRHNGELLPIEVIVYRLQQIGDLKTSSYPIANAKGKRIIMYQFTLTRGVTSKRTDSTEDSNFCAALRRLLEDAER